VTLGGRGFAVAAALLAALVFVGAAGSSADEDGTPRCRGALATIVGTAGDDVLLGSEDRDVIVAGAGDDEVYGGRANDIICGGPGADLLQGGRGNDTIDAGAGDRDRAIGGLGDDHITGGPGEYDEVAGHLGIDTLNGGPGSFDLVHGDYGYDRMDGGPGGGDIASFATAAAAGRGGGVWVSLRAGKARGDGHDRLFRLESIEGSAFADTLIGDRRANTIDGGPGDDVIRGGGGGGDEIDGGQGSDRCAGAGSGARSCGKEAAPRGSVYVQIDAALGGGGGLALVGGAGADAIVALAFDPGTGTFGVAAEGPIALGPGCRRALRKDPKRAVCDPGGPARWLLADLGPGNDSLRVEGSLAGAQNVRLAGGLGDDTIRGGPEDDLIEAGRGSDRLYGGDGEDGLIGGLPGPTFLYGEGDGDLLAAGGGCAGGALVGGPGRDNASFAETQAHPGLLYISQPLGKAWIDVLPARVCPPVRIDRSSEDIEGSFDDDVLIGDSRGNNMLGQPGRDRFYGNGGDDVIDARDGVRDFVIQCARKGAEPEGRALADSFDPGSTACAIHRYGTPVSGLNNSG
jgi:Ca2+-binding RTX toxin-like protein